MLSEYEMRKCLDARLPREGASESAKTTCVVLYRPEFVEITGSLNAALMLSQCVCWHYVALRNGKQSFYKSPEEWEYETGLTKKQMVKARRTLSVLGFVRFKSIGRHKKTYYWVDTDRIVQRISTNREDKT